MEKCVEAFARPAKLLAQAIEQLQRGRVHQPDFVRGLAATPRSPVSVCQIAPWPPRAGPLGRIDFLAERQLHCFDQLPGLVRLQFAERGELASDDSRSPRQPRVARLDASAVCGVQEARRVKMKERMQRLKLALR